MPLSYTRKANKRKGKRKQRLRRRQRTLRKQAGGPSGAIRVHVPHVPIKKVYVITLNPNSSRMLHFTRDAQATDLPFEIFKGVNGDTLQTSILPMLGIGKVIYTTRGDPTQRKNLGTIGCYLSHRYLYEKIVKEDPDLDGCYLIFEDDATFPPDFQDILQDTLRDVPKDWDIIYLSKNGKIAATPVTSIISKLKKQEDSASNFGTWAQIYRVRFLKEELLPYLKNMTDEIDTQIVRKFDEWNAYCYIPSLVLIQPGSKSGIDPVD